MHFFYHYHHYEGFFLIYEKLDFSESWSYEQSEEKYQKLYYLKYFGASFLQNFLPLIKLEQIFYLISSLA